MYLLAMKSNKAKYRQYIFMEFLKKETGIIIITFN